MKHLATAFVGACIVVLTTGCTAHFAPHVMQEGRNARSGLVTYQDDDGTRMFRYTVMYFTKVDKEKQRSEAQVWLTEWLAETNYCQQGYEIVKNDYRPWPHALLDPVDIGGTVIATGRCKSKNSLVTAPQ